MLTPLFSDEEEHPIPTAAIKYGFTLGARGGRARKPQILAHWIPRYAYRADRVYMRTADGIYVSRLTSLDDLIHNASEPFMRSSVSVAVNILRVQDPDLFTKQKTLSFVVGADTPCLPIEHVVVSKTYLVAIGGAFGIPPSSFRGTPDEDEDPAPTPPALHCPRVRSPSP